MPELKIGKVRLAFKGAWNNTATYEALDTVTRNGESWAALIDVPANVEPNVNNTLYWEKIAARGEQGPEGPQGIQGPEGPEGPQGEQGPAGGSTWADIAGKPDTATRWPSFGEVTAKPETATRWPTFGEVTGKPATYPADPAQHTHNKITTLPAYSAPFNNGAATPRSFHDAGLCYVFIRQADGWPVSLGQLLNIPSFSAAQDGGALQIITPYAENGTSNGSFIWRTGKFDNLGWSPWRTAATDEDLAALDTAVTAALDDILNGGLFISQTNAKGWVESVHTGTGTAIDASLGAVWSRAVTANVNFTSNLASGQSQVVMLTGGNGFTVGWPSGIKWAGGTPPTLTTADALVFWRVGAVLYGSYIGSVE